MGQSCSNCSRYKMVFNLRSDHAGLKVIGKGGGFVNPAIWCFLRQNKRTMEKVFAEMLGRVTKHPKLASLYFGSNNIRLYDRKTDQFLEKSS